MANTLSRSSSNPVIICGAATVLLLSGAKAPGQDNEPTVGQESVRVVACQSASGERNHCSANADSGVVLLRSTGSAQCLLGRNWGYDDRGIWVQDGCGGEFAVGPASDPRGSAPAAPVDSAATDEGPATGDTASQPGTRREAWGFLDPGDGFLIGRSDAGELSLSAYALLRFINQTGDDTFIDHQGREQPVDLRRDIYSHRILVWLKGWIGLEKLVYTIAFWTVNTTDQDALFANLGYQFSKRFNLYAGINGNPGSRSLQGSHPYWLGHDRVMADEFFRPFFSQGVWANGELLPGLWYSAMVGNTSSTLGVTASELDRDFTYGASMWWTPTTGEFGPRGAYGDWEMHEELATRFGFSTVFSPEERYTDIGEDSGNTAIKLADSLNAFSTGALAPGVTVTDLDYQILALDAGMKYRGFFLQTEFYFRQLDNFVADGALPVDTIEDWGFYVQSSFFPIPKKLELYAATSQIFGDEDAGFSDSSEYLVGMNYYPANTRNHRLNVQIMDVNNSPVSSTFGYYTGGQNGTTYSVAFSIFF